MISVFRIYLGQAWAASGRAADIVAMLDAQPELLYSVCQLPASEAGDPALTADERRSFARLALTQAHVVLLPAEAPVEGDAWTAIEIQVARTGLRQRLPVIAVRHPDSPGDGPAANAADQVQPWNSAEIACAIQQAVEAAAADRRKRLQASAAADGAGAEPIVEPKRQLPTAEIAEAYVALRQRRGLPIAPT